MKLYYSFPVKLLALVLLLILLTGAGLGLFTVAICVDGDAYDSGSDFFDSWLADRACREYGDDVESLLMLYATNERQTVSSQEYLNRMRERFSSNNTNLRVLFESEDAGSVMTLDGMLSLNEGYQMDGSERLVATLGYDIQVSGGLIGRWTDLDSRMAELEWELRSEAEWQTPAAPYADEDWHDGPEFDYSASPYYEGGAAETEPVDLPESLRTYIRVNFYVDPDLPVYDKFTEANTWYQMLKHVAYPALGLCAGCSLLGLLLWLYLMCAAGHRPNTDKGVITLRFIDRIPYDLFLALCVLAFTPLTAMLSEMTWVQTTVDLELYFIVLVSCVFGYAVTFAVLTLSTASRWKSHTLLRNTITWRVCAWLWRGLSGGAGLVAGRLQPRELTAQETAQKEEQRAQKQEQRSQTIDRVGKGTRAAVGAVGGLFARGWRKCGGLFEILPLVWKGLLLLLAVAFVNLFLIQLVFWDGNVFCLLLTAIFDLAVLWGYLSILREMVWLHNGAKKIAAGDLNYRIPDDVMHWEFKTHAEALNTIRDGIDAAVEERVRAVKARTQSERMRSELLTNVSHDIKTPLTSIINYVGLLQKEPIESEKAREYIEVLGRQSDRLKKLLEDLLEASKASTGNIAVNAAPTSVGELLRQVTGEYAEKLAAAGIEPIVTLPGHDAMIYADGRLLWRVFDNLMANIVKYAMPQTRVYLDLHSDASITAIAVKNVSRERLNIAAEELMERFVRGDSSRSTEGSGLGLSIAQSLTELMGGTFELIIDGDLFKVQIGFPTLHETPDSAPSAPSEPRDGTVPLETMQAAEPAAAVPVTEPAKGKAPARRPFFARKYTLKMAMEAKAAAEQAEAEAAAREEQAKAAETADTAEKARAGEAAGENGESDAVAPESDMPAPEAVPEATEPEAAAGEMEAAAEETAEEGKAAEETAEEGKAMEETAEPSEKTTGA